MRLALLLLFLIPCLAFASTDDARAHQLFRQFRCMVCQGQSLDESDAPLAKDLREQIKQQMHQGKSDEAIKEYLQERYGDYILFSPPFKPATLLLWLGPFMILLAGGIGIVYYIKHADQTPS